MKQVLKMHVDEFIFNYCVSSMITDEVTSETTECAMNVFSIDENKIRDANGIIFAEAITCYKCTFCGKMFSAMEVVLTHYQSNHRCSVIPLLTTGVAKLPIPKYKPRKPVIGSLNHQKTSPKTTSTLKNTIKSNDNTEGKSDTENQKLNHLSQMTPKDNNNNKSLKTGNLKKISKKVNQKYRFRCNHSGCSVDFYTKTGLLMHMKTHEKIKSYKCNWIDCKFKCSDLAGLEFHKKTHLGDNPFKCSWPGCDHSFADSTAKELHLQSAHIDDKILECDQPGCGAKFKLASDREIHKYSHSGKKISAPKSQPIVISVRRRGRPLKAKKTIDLSSSSSVAEDSDDQNDSEESEEEEREDIDENHYKTDENKSIKKSDISKTVNKKETNINKCDQPLDLSKNGPNVIHDYQNKSKRIDIKSKSVEKSVSKRGRKRKKSIEKKLLSKTVYRCDYPGCRKTFTESDVLKQHEKETHNTSSCDGRQRYGRSCKGNLFYKI
ncbi:zinc finger protein GLI2-like [Oppia nitens]|uniref:zinc finger protein GLI2-like n=1 Tax=Oppia nitens TaxID=1686743 RepID=UPI0023D97F61|nr:zinc finger protein GLI2-like [Oppia nitens]